MFLNLVNVFVVIPFCSCTLREDCEDTCSRTYTVWIRTSSPEELLRPAAVPQPGDAVQGPSQPLRRGSMLPPAGGLCTALPEHRHQSSPYLLTIYT
ncbi:hypothetical protein CgunFtcFv8_013705 [Champsocephalus gunnari]|uniref:Secreted protein n=1 Tax=Champsocephalus gunnari TaxID=52237 RepID=A0AAN8HUB2_CHAGU|nr:hypothetical protein CgunFtcFv8_013705 [Champsocephalus gunnari]